MLCFPDVTVYSIDKKTIQSYKLNYFIKLILNKEPLLKAVQYLSSMNLLKPTTVYILAHFWKMLRHSFLHIRSLPTVTTATTT